MKKLVAIICAMAMFFSFASVAQADEWDFLNQQYKSYDATAEFYLKLNKPLECLSVFNEEAGVDVQYIVEELCKAKFTAHIQAEIAPDATAAKMYMGLNSNVPINISEDLKFGTDVTLHAWVEFDFSDVENAKYSLIVKNPLNGKFMYLDLFDEALMGVEATELKSMMVSTFESLNVEKGIGEIAQLIKTVYAGNATVEKTSDGYTQVSFTNDGLVDMAFELVYGMLETEYMKNAMAVSGADAAELEFDKSEAEQARAFIKGLGLFADKDAYIMKFKTNAKGQIAEAVERMNIQFNMYDLAVALGEDAEYLYPLTKENSDLDITFESKMVYDKINEENVVVMPHLTEENSVSFVEEFGLTALEPEYEEIGLEMYQSEYFWDSARGMTDRNGMYVNMEEFLGSSYWDSDNLTGEVTLGENGAVAITLTSNNFGTVTVNGSLYSDEYKLNDMALWARKPFKVQTEYDWEGNEGREVVYVNMDVLHYVLGAKVQMVQTYILDEDMNEITSPEYYFEIIRPNPAYVAPME